MRDPRRVAGIVVGILFLLLASSPAAQPGTGAVGGTVTDEDGGVVPAVAVTISGGALEEPATQQTDARGRYLFLGVPAGTYELGFDADGFAPETRDGVRVKAGDRVYVTATLRRAKRFDLELTVDSGSTSVITNKATASTSTQEANPGDETTTEDTTVTTRADLVIRKTDSPDPVVAGTAIEYTVTVENNGPSDARYVEVSDTLPAGTTFQSTTGCAEDPGGVATCTLGTIPAGGSKTFTVAATVKPSTTGSITNQASVSSQTAEAKPGDETIAEATAVDARADLSVAVSDAADPATAGTALSYAVTVKNAGPSDAQEVAVEATLPAGAVFGATSGCAEDPGGVPTCTLGTIPASGAKQFTVALRVDAGAVADLALEATARAATAEARPGDETATETTALDARADLSVAVDDSVDPVVAGTPLAYTVTVKNAGPSDARDVAVTAELPGGVVFGSSTGCAEDPGGERTCTLGTIPAGGSKQYSIALAVDPGTTSALAFAASLATPTGEARPGDERAEETTAVEARADLVLTSRDSVDPVVAGLPLTYTVTVKNNGPSDARDVAVAGSLPAGVTFRSTTGCAEDGAPGGGVATCTLGTIPAGESKQYRIDVQVNPDATGVITNRARASSSTTEDRPGDESTDPAPTFAPAPPPRAAPVVPGAADEAADVVRAWARAWSEQRVDDYLAFYADGFRPPGGTSRVAWAAARRDRLTAPRRIEVRVDNLEAELLTARRARVRFDQTYRSDRYDDDVRKELILEREGGSWKIVEERVVE